MKYFLFVLTILSSIGFFNYHGIITPQINKVLFYFNMLLCFVWAVRDGVSLRNVEYPRVAYLLLLIGMSLSCIMASAFHSQSLTVSIIATLPIVLAYSFFWILMKFDIPRHKVLKAYMVILGVSSVVYFCNVLTAPNNMFGEPIINEDLTRGILRLPVVLLQMFPLFTFYGINQWMLTRKRVYIVIIAASVLMVFLSVTRQTIALTLALGALFMFRNLSFVKKGLLVVAAISVVVFVLPTIPVYRTMIELSEDQRDSNDQKEDSRIMAWRYYTYENQTNSITPIFGNGVPSLNSSIWGKMFDSETQVNRCFAADVGWAGFFWNYGIIATGALLLMIIKAYLKPKDKREQYLNYWLLYIALTSIASAPILYYYEALDLAVVLYLIFKKDDMETEQDADSSDGRLAAADACRSRAILPRYPQLN